MVERPIAYDFWSVNSSIFEFSRKFAVGANSDFHAVFWLYQISFEQNLHGAGEQFFKDVWIAFTSFCNCFTLNFNFNKLVRPFLQVFYIKLMIFGSLISIFTLAFILNVLPRFSWIFGFWKRGVWKRLKRFKRFKRLNRSQTPVLQDATKHFFKKGAKTKN